MAALDFSSQEKKKKKERKKQAKRANFFVIKKKNSCLKLLVEVQRKMGANSIRMPFGRFADQKKKKLNSYRPLVDKAAVFDYSIYTQKIAYLTKKSHALSSFNPKEEVYQTSINSSPNL